ncbi:hypothetical protein BDV95DRAFT_572211 [Massariosphaeria phaeospora]|uniref:Uncharacterized protein n=1 Tax=Massariosphaeria phaeospora TaxID=100035 RepID=A0A7C8MBT4_9PLEO|nr:hypothetical protein BDV95DRAFT_572211 [Massariosphaeria phaeospora]
MMPRTAFISGPLDAPDEYFDTHYRARIDQAIRDGDNFVMGPVAGIDTMALQYLLAHPDGVLPRRITVYMAHFEYQTVARRKSFEALGVNVREVGDVHTTTGMRDAKMTEESDYDVLRYRSESEAKEWYGSAWWPRVSNTEMNERRRKGVWSREYTLGGSVREEGEREEHEESEKETSTKSKRFKRVFGLK